MRKVIISLVFLLFVLVGAHAQTKTIKGRITQNNDVGIPSATVKVKGGTIGTKTAEDGSFTLTVPATAKLLVVSSLNFEDQEVDISTATIISVSLKATTKNLDEVLVVAYGTRKKSEFTGSALRSYQSRRYSLLRGQ